MTPSLMSSRERRRALLTAVPGFMQLDRGKLLAIMKGFALPGPADGEGWTCNDGA
jgi:hypothetical protein